MWSLLHPLALALAPQGYEIEALGQLGAYPNYAVALNDAGQAAGYDERLRGFNLNWRPLLWTDGGARDLGVLWGVSAWADALNNSGQVVGYSQAPGFTYSAMLWANGVPTPLPSPSGRMGRAHAINDAGVVAGTAELPYGQPVWERHACLWIGGTWHDLGTLGGADSYAYDLNERGQVVGEAKDAGQVLRAFLWQDGAMLPLPSIHNASATAWAINERGVVVGASYDGAGARFATCWDDGVLTVLPGLGSDSAAFAINDAGVIVGYSVGSGGRRRAVRFDAAGAVDLNTFLPSGSGWELREAQAINDAGMIAGYGSYQGADRAWVMTPDGLLLTLVPGSGFAGAAAAVAIDGATPNARLQLWLAQRPGASVVPGCAPLRFDLHHPVAVSHGRSDSAGELTLSLPVPAALAGLLLHAQALEPATCRLSNALSLRLR